MMWTLLYVQARCFACIAALNMLLVLYTAQGIWRWNAGSYTTDNLLGLMSDVITKHLGPINLSCQ